MYQVDYKIYATDKIPHSRLFNAKNKKEAKVKFKEYCDGMGLKCDIVDITKI